MALFLTHNIPVYTHYFATGFLSHLDVYTYADDPTPTMPNSNLCQEVKELIRACEAIHGRIAIGETLTDEEIEVVEYCMIDLLTRLKPKK